MRDILLIGGGGHCKSVIDTIHETQDYNIAGIIDVKEKVGTYVHHVQIIGTDEELNNYYQKGVKYAFISLGSIGNTTRRIRLYEYAKKIGYQFPVIIDKTSIVSENAVVEEGTFIGKGTIINTHAQIGKNCIINSGSIIEHDCILEDFVHIAPGSVLSGGVIIGRNTHIGTNTTIIQNITIGQNAVIGAGSVVVKNLGSYVKAFGNPCREVV